MRVRLLTPAQRPTLDETRPAPFRKADIDDIEVPRDDRPGEDRARLPRDLRAEVAVREVRQRKHLHTRRLRELRGPGRARVKRLVGPGLFLGRERRLMHEEIRLSGDLEHLERGPRIAC